MKIEILKETKNELEITLNSLTVAEVLREYLNKDSNVIFSAWRKEQTNKPVILRIETKGKTVKKAVEDAVEQIEKDAEKLVSEVKKV